MDYFIKAVDEAAMWSALEAAGLARKEYSAWDEDGNPVGGFEWRKSDGYDLDIVGVIFKPSGEIGLDADGNEIPVMEALPGYHANIRSHSDQLPKAVVDALAPVLIAAPNNPVRVFA